MRLLRLFRDGRALGPLGGAAQDRAERLLADAFRALGTLCSHLADQVESQRLARSGYQAQGKFLERLETPPTAPRD